VHFIFKGPKGEEGRLGMKGDRGEQVELYLCPLLFTYEGRFINKLQNIILLIFKI